MKAKEIRKVACIGAGTIGSSWAAYFLVKGLNVTIQDVNGELIGNSEKRILGFLKSMAEKGIIPMESIASLQNNLTSTTSIAEAVKDVDFIQESTLEKYEIKKGVIEEIDSSARNDIVLSSSSSGLLASKLQEYSRYPGRLVVGHPFNPPHIIPLVEIIKGNADEDAVQCAYDFYKEIGKVPIIINKEVPGHVANRIQAALWRESIDLVMNGVCSVKDVDAAVAFGPGLRWALMGPNMIFNLGGGPGGIEAFFGQFKPAFESWWKDMATWNEFPEGSKEALKEGLKEEMGDRDMQEIAEWRDDKLINLLKILKYV